MYQDAVARLDQDVIECVSGQRIAQGDIENLRRTVGHGTEELRRVEPCFRRDSASLVDGVAEMLLAAGPVAARRAHFTSDQHFGRGLEIVTAEDPHGIERLELRRVLRMLQRRRKVESMNYRTVIRRSDANNLGIAPRGFRQQVFV